MFSPRDLAKLLRHRCAADAPIESTEASAPRFENLEPRLLMSADAGGPYEVGAGGMVDLVGSGVAEVGGDLSYAWDLDNDGIYGESGVDAANGDENVQNPTFVASGLAAGDEVTVTLRVSDDGGPAGEDTATITVINSAPQLSNVVATASDEGGTATLTGDIADVDALDAFTVTIDWGDGNVEMLDLAAGATGFEATHSYLDDDPTGTASDDYTVSVTVTDSSDASDDAMTTATVNNVAPVVSNLAATTIDENGTTTLTGDIADPGTLDTFTVTIDWGDGNSEMINLAAGATGFEATHQYLDDDPTGTPSDQYTISVTVTDDDTGSDDGSTEVTVNNVAPEITELSSNASEDDDLFEGHEMTLQGAFTDVGTLDTHTAVVDWGDGTMTDATLTQGSGSGSFEASHTYANGGVFTVTVTLMDDDTGVDTMQTTVYIVGAGVNNGVLQVVGTNGDDGPITINRQGNGLYKVHADFFEDGPFKTFKAHEVESIEVYLRDGNDHLNVAGNIRDVPIMVMTGGGRDKVNGPKGMIVVKQMASVIGTLVLEGTDGNDNIRVRAGKVAGSVVVYGAAGIDNGTVFYGVTDVQIETGEGHDKVIVGKGIVTPDGEPMAFSISTGEGNDKVVTGDGDDVVDAGNGNNRIVTRGGNDMVATGTGNDVVNTGDGDDSVDAGEGRNKVITGYGLDLVVDLLGDNKVRDSDKRIEMAHVYFALPPIETPVTRGRPETTPPVETPPVPTGRPDDAGHPDGAPDFDTPVAHGQPDDTPPVSTPASGKANGHANRA